MVDEPLDERADRSGGWTSDSSQQQKAPGQAGKG